MPLSDDVKALFYSHQDKPLVGLIHKQTNRIVLAPCIPQKVSLVFNEEGVAVSGMFLTTHCVENGEISEVELNAFNALLQDHHMPRLAYTHDAPFEQKSAHQFLFEQQCPSTKPSEWGGFTIVLDASGKLEHTFVSGAFNSGAGPRRQGATLSQELISEVKKQTAELGFEATNTEITYAVDPSLSFLTPERKHQRVERMGSPIAHSCALFFTHSEGGRVTGAEGANENETSTSLNALP